MLIVGDSMLGVWGLGLLVVLVWCVGGLPLVVLVLWLYCDILVLFCCWLF